ncbi:reactive intermediate/imine deaminase [SAR86 cluster bacterium SAR86E]|jgi:2-iminobutanoate/2-iminopropanoate deaminase|uniref:Reactive intermediate/imine deaminase n=1 Tax=SAR86 cluster bacterium SAR86E TaxID=1208365 RepID=K6GGF3_9GAMM|nr:reactive intermediate/imine deaminase [SAR86 cluster bacterium SAR86E]
MKKPIFTNKAPEALGPYSQAIQWGDVVFISGQIPLIPSTGELNDASFSDQANQVIDNLEAICIEAGASLDHILKLTIFLTNLEKFDVVNKIMERRFSEPFPARATVEISKLPKGVEIEMDAILSIQA